MKVLCFGYREWSQKIFRNIFSTKEFENDAIFIVTTKKKGVKKFIDSVKPDVILFYGWSWYISSDIINTYTCIGLHPSPLPKYRGGSPIQNQIQCGEKVSAVTLFEITEKLDAGDILFQEEISLDGFIDNIFGRIISTGTTGTISVLRQIKNGVSFGLKQNEEVATEYKRLKNNSEITIEDLQNMSATKLYDKIRMLSGFFPNAYIQCKGGAKLYIERVRLEEGGA